jgi:hypothetical protein
MLVEAEGRHTQSSNTASVKEDGAKAAVRPMVDLFAGCGGLDSLRYL